LLRNTPEIASIIDDPREALNVMDFEEAAHSKVPPSHWSYIESGVDDDLTLRATATPIGASSFALPGCMMQPKSTRESNCSALSITVPSLRALLAANARCIPMGNSPSPAPLKYVARYRFWPLPPQPTLRT
jgi:hypothetical protein